MHLQDKKELQKQDGGSVLMEALICLPVLLLLSLAVGQFAHIWYCRTIVQYAAYCGARATLTASTAEGRELQLASEAARQVCSLVAFTYGLDKTDADNIVLPGIGRIPGSADVDRKMTVQVTSPNDNWHRMCEVQMKIPLMFPFAGQIIGQAMRIYNNGDFDIQPGNVPDGSKIITHEFQNEFSDGFFFPHIILKERCYMVKPFRSTWAQD